jgi:hypothetical protein
MAKEGLSKELGDWKALVGNVRARLPEFPHLTDMVAGFDAFIVEAEEFQRVHDIHRRQLRETTQRSKDIERRGRSFRNRLVAGVQSTYGVDSVQLVEFGVNPRQATKRRRLTPVERVVKLTADLEAAKVELEKKG